MLIECDIQRYLVVISIKRYKTIIASQENKFEILGAVIEEPHNRKIAKELEVSHMSMFKILKKRKYCRYHLQPINNHTQWIMSEELIFACGLSIETKKTMIF